MATEFKTRTKSTKGLTNLIVRCQSKSPKLDYRMTSGLVVDIQAWNKAKKSNTTMTNFRNANPVLAEKMDAIKQNLDAALRKNPSFTKEEMREIIDAVVYVEARKAKEKLKEEKKKKEAEEKKMTLNKFIKMYVDQISNGARQTEKGTNYAPSTVRTIRHTMKVFQEFQEDNKRALDFDQIDMTVYYSYTSYLKKKGYSINSVGKCIKELKSVLAAAESEGYDHNGMWKDKKFKGTRVEVDSIYLTREDLDKLMAVDLSQLSPGYEQARDIFMVGVWTAQRVSDYNNIKKEDFDILKKNVLREERDPEHPENNLAWVEEQEITYLNIRQKKTGAKVSIPCNTELTRILQKYDYEMPHLEDQVINRYIKEIAKLAGINEPVEIVTTKGGTPKRETFEKWELIHTHTARRTGATLMYLAGVDIYDIMKVTGHSSPAMLKKYIKADNLTIVSKLTDKYSYFN